MSRPHQGPARNSYLWLLPARLQAVGARWAVCPPHSQAPRPLVPGSEQFRPPQPVPTDTHPVASTVWAVSAAQAPVAPAYPASVCPSVAATPDRCSGSHPGPPSPSVSPLSICPLNQALAPPPKSSSGPAPFAPRPEPGFTHPGAQPLRVSAASPCPASPPGKPLWCPLGVCEAARAWRGASSGRTERQLLASWLEASPLQGSSLGACCSASMCWNF